MEEGGAMVRAVLLVVMLWIGAFAPRGASSASHAAAQEATPAANCPATTEEENTAIVQRWYDAFNAGDLDAVADALAPVIVQHAADFADAKGVDEVRASMGAFMDAFPDMQHDIEVMVADDDLVAARVIAHGTHQGEFMGIPATGKDVTWSILSIYRIACGQIAEQWSEVDALGRLQQLGAVPLPGGPAGAPPAEVATPETPSRPAASCPATTEAENETLVRRWYDEVLTQGNFDNVDDLIADDYVHHRVLDRITTSGADRGRSPRENRAALPDLETTVDLLLTDGDLVAARWTATGTHEGPWVGIEPTGAELTWTGNTIFRIECGRLAEQWSEADTLGVFRQMGVVEWPPAAP